jgi:transposase
MSADGGIHATGDHNNVRSVLRNTKKLRSAIQDKRHGIMTSDVVLHHDNARPHTAARLWALLERFNWELFDHPPYSPDLAPSDYHQFTYLKNWLRSQRFWNDEMMKVSKRGWAHRRQTPLTGAYKNLLPDTTSASTPTMTTLRSSLSMYVFFVYCWMQRPVAR